MNDVKQQPEYKQLLNFLKDSTGLNVENDILSKFNSCSSFVLVPKGKDMEAAGIFKTSANPQGNIMKFVNFFQMQNNSISITDSNIQGYSLKHLKTDKLPYSVYFGVINNNNFIIGQQNAIKDVINAIKEDQTPTNTLKKTQIAIYIDSFATKELVQKFNKRKIPIDNIDFVKAEFSIDDSIINSFIKIGENKSYAEAGKNN